MTMLSVVDHKLEQKHQEEQLSKKATNKEATPAVTLEAPKNDAKKEDDEYEYPSRYSMYVKEDKDQALVRTPFGPGLVIRTRKHPKTGKVVSREIELTEWKTAPPQKGPPKPAMLYSSTEYPSVEAKVGSDVTCLFGRGRVEEIRGNHAVVKLSTWRLAGRSRITCFVKISDIQVVRPKRVYEMSVFERVEHAQALKEEARKIFVQKDYERALSKYALAVDAVRYVQHQVDSTNYVRADLLVVMITCCNNAATCATQDKNSRADLVTKYARNALVLIEALEERQTATKTTRVFDILTKEGFGAVKIFGEWKGKALLFLAKAQTEKANYAEAMADCAKAEQAVSKYLAEDPDNKVLQMHQKEINRLRVVCQTRRKLDLKKEKQRAQAMFGGGSPSKENASAEKMATPSPTAAATTAAPPTTTAAPKSAPFSSIAKQPETNGNKSMGGTVRKSVTYEDGGRPSDEYDNSKKNDTDDEEEELPWYEEHQELIVLVGVLGLGLGLAQMLLGRRSRH